MISVAVSGAGGRMGQMVAGALAEAEGIALGHLYDPPHAGLAVADRVVSADPDLVADSDLVIEFTHPEVVMANLALWHDMGVHAVVGTSGFSDERLAEVRELWTDATSNCLIVPNFAIGAVLMMKFAELAAPHFPAAEIIELHHDRKADAPSGTAIATAVKIAAAQPNQVRAVTSTELVAGATGAQIEGVTVHSVRLPGIVADQEVIFGGPGQTLTIRHDTTDRTAFAPGVLLAARQVHRLTERVTVGLDVLLGI